MQNKNIPQPVETQQQHRDDCNINKLIARFKKGETPLGNGRTPMYGDFSNHTDFHDMQNKVAQANQDFMALPAYLRKEFNNSAEQLIEFLSDENNLERAIELGLIEKPLKDTSNDPIEVVIKSQDSEESGAPKA